VFHQTIALVPAQVVSPSVNIVLFITVASLCYTTYMLYPQTSVKLQHNHLND